MNCFRFYSVPTSPCIRLKKRRASHATWNAALSQPESPTNNQRKRFNSLPRTLTCADNPNDGLPKEKDSKNKNNEKFKNQLNKKESFNLVPPPCTCPYFGDTPHHNTLKPASVKIIPTSRSFRSTSSSLHDTTVHSMSNSTSMSIAKATTSTSPSKCSLQLLPVPPTPPVRKHSYSKSNSVVTWDTKRNQRRGSSFGGAKTTLQVKVIFELIFTFCLKPQSAVAMPKIGTRIFISFERTFTSFGLL